MSTTKCTFRLWLTLLLIKKQSSPVVGVITSQAGVINISGADQMKPGHLESSQPSYRGKTHSASYKVVAVPNLLFIQEIPEIQTFGDKETLY